jgi:hypothetical protein
MTNSLPFVMTIFVIAFFPNGTTQQTFQKCVSWSPVKNNDVYGRIPLRLVWYCRNIYREIGHFTVHKPYGREKETSRCMCERVELDANVCERVVDVSLERAVFTLNRIDL